MATARRQTSHRIKAADRESGADRAADRSAIDKTLADRGLAVLRRRPGAGAGGDLGGPLVRHAGRAGARLQRRDPRAVVRPGLAVRRVLRDPMAADPQLGGSRRAGGPGPGAPRLGGRPDHDQRDARRVRRCRSSGCASGSPDRDRRGIGPPARHLPAAALLAALLAMNITWLLGFTSFTLGACLFPITLGYWWPRRDRLGAGGVLGAGGAAWSWATSVTWSAWD